MSSFADGIQSIMLKQADPSYMQSQELMSSFTKKLNLESQSLKAQTISNIGPLLEEAIARGADAVIIDAYRSILASTAAL